MDDIDIDGCLVLEPREVFDAAIVGTTTEPDDHWSRRTNTKVVIYSRDKCIERMVGAWDMSYEDAVDHFEFNVSGAWVGEQTPTFVDDDAPEDE